MSCNCTMRGDQTDGVIEQVAESAWQTVSATPGVFGLKVFVAEEVTSDSVRVTPPSQETPGKDGTDMLDTAAETAEFIHAMQQGVAPGGKHLYPAFPYP